MNTNYDNEATQYQNADNEATQFTETSKSEQANNNATSDNEVQATPAKGRWKNVAVGAASGLVIGGVATSLMSMNKVNSDEPEKTNNHKEELSNPEWVDDQVQVATTVTDEMTFGEAFAAARAEVGAGGCFEWHGTLYGTYTADEWNNMTGEQREEWNNHFNWNNIDNSSSNVAQHSAQPTASSTHSASTHEQATVSNDDDIEVISVNHSEGQNNLAQANTQQTPVYASIDEGTVSDSEVQFLGVVHDSETGANVGGMIIDGQEVVLVDVDNDIQFDYMAADTNHNNKIEEGEIVDIQDQGLTVNDLGGFANPTDNLFASNNDIDYSTDAVYEG